jgi:hypothetical protein
MVLMQKLGINCVVNWDYCPNYLIPQYHYDSPHPPETRRLKYHNVIMILTLRKPAVFVHEVGQGKVSIRRSPLRKINAIGVSNRFTAGETRPTLGDLVESGGMSSSDSSCLCITIKYY